VVDAVDRHAVVLWYRRSDRAGGDLLGCHRAPSS
jgi:hypothetical protein